MRPFSWVEAAARALHAHYTSSGRSKRHSRATLPIAAPLAPLQDIAANIRWRCKPRQRQAPGCAPSRCAGLWHHASSGMPWHAVHRMDQGKAAGVKSVAGLCCRRQQRQQSRTHHRIRLPAADLLPPCCHSPTEGMVQQAGQRAALAAAAWALAALMAAPPAQALPLAFLPVVSPAAMADALGGAVAESVAGAVVEAAGDAVADAMPDGEVHGACGQQTWRRCLSPLPSPGCLAPLQARCAWGGCLSPTPGPRLSFLNPSAA